MENKQHNHSFFAVNSVKNKPYEAPYISSTSYETDVICSSNGQYDNSTQEFYDEDTHWGVTN